MKFVKGFFSNDPDGLTAIGNVADVTGLTIEEIESTMDIINIDNIIEIMFEPELNQ